MTDYSADFPNKVVPKNVGFKFKNMDEKLKAKIEKWYYSVPQSTMREAFQPQPLDIGNEKLGFNRRKNEFSQFVDAKFKGGVIDRPLLDPLRRPITPEQLEHEKMVKNRDKMTMSQKL